ncbi:UMP kinase [Spiroplasma endosymbiont of Crioceris asparagi]|uniref:UMP kinase n=1 Tax=Spiroplasma endosymbiont of Crioceris asparagi TaxID=3066286 RepID=UPI0030D37A68
MNYKRVLLKISGESLKSDSDHEIYSQEKMVEVVEQIIELKKQGIQPGIVIGAGNIWRGKLAGTLRLNKIDADYMGMMATIMNGLALEGVFKSVGFNKVKLYSALEIKNVTSPYNYRDAREYLDNGYVVIFAGGTGYSNFTTDTAASLRAIEIGADVLLLGKNGVKGVYDSDPKINNNAVFFKHLSFQDVLVKGLQIMDPTAITVCRDGNIKIVVFDVVPKGNIIKLINNKIESTLIE